MSTSFFFIMIRPPPRSTLFPSPPLFRSRLNPLEDPVRRRGERAGPPVPGFNEGDLPRLERAGDLVPLLRQLDDELVELREDRKSTRLNSSHANISYAVFCLKKKKIPY